MEEKQRKPYKKREKPKSGARLTCEQVSQIKFDWKGGKPQAALAREFGVSATTIHYVLNGVLYASCGE